MSNQHNPFVRVRAVKPLEGYVVHVTFTDGSERDINLENIFMVPRSNKFVLTKIFSDKYLSAMAKHSRGPMARTLTPTFCTMTSRPRGC